MGKVSTQEGDVGQEKGADMFTRAGGLAVLLLWAVAGPESQAGPRVGKLPPPKNPLALLGNGSPDALAGNLRGYLVRALPHTLLEDNSHWGQQKWVTRGIAWRGKGLRVRPFRKRKLKNHGRWWKVRVTADRPQDTLIVDMRDVLQPERGRMLFTTYVAMDLRVYYDQQNWRSGIRIWAGSVRARLRVKLVLHCEAIAKLDTKGKILPDVVLRLRVWKAHLHYDNLVFEHVPGVGGELAKMLGALVIGSMKQWRPSLERELLARANAAIVKAADTKEVRISLLKLLKGKD